MHRREHLFPLLIFSLLTIGGTYFAFSQDPEEILAQSNDKALIISGRTSLKHRIELVDVAQHDPFFWGVYDLFPHETLFEYPLTLSPQNPEESVYHFNQSLEMWERVHTWINSSGQYGISKQPLPKVSFPVAGVPDPQDCPNGAVGYEEIYAIHSQGDTGDLVRLPAPLIEAGCAGVVQVGDSTFIQKNDIRLAPEEPILTVMRVWTIRSSGGCAVDEPLELLK